MQPREFLDDVVVPNLRAFRGEKANRRMAFNAAMSVDALAAHIFHAVGPLIAGARDDSGFDGYRTKLAGKNPDFKLLRDIANAERHVSLTGRALINGASDIKGRALGWDTGAFDEAAFDAEEEIVILVEPPPYRSLDAVLTNALELLTGEMEKFAL